MAQERRTIEEFGLERREDDSHYEEEYSFLVPFAGPLTEAEFLNRQNSLPDSVDPYGVHQYAINSTKKIYVVYTAFLLDPTTPTGRSTEMRLWQMIVANYIHAGNTPDSLRYLGISHIVNLPVRIALKAEWAHQLSQGQEPYGTPIHRMLTITAANSFNTWTNNTFCRSGLRVAESLSTAEKPLTLDKVHLIRIGEMDGPDVTIIWDLVMDFKNGDAGQESYRERLIRELLPMVAHIQEQ